MNMPYPDIAPLLLANIPEPATPTQLALAGTIALAPRRHGPWRAPIAGLTGAELKTLVCQHFPTATDLLPLLHAWRREGKHAAHNRIDEFDDLLALLLENRSQPGRESRWLAHAIATASMADNHLWQDLGLPSRAELNALMQIHFTPLKQKNVGNMKWKKFFYRQLCERAGVPICKAPSCGVCIDHSVCFGPED